MDDLRLTIVTPNKTAAELTCDSVRMEAQDDACGRNGGGIGIRKGHTPAMIALSEGFVTAYREGKCVFRARVKPGYATVRDNTVTVLTEQADAESE